MPKSGYSIIEESLNPEKTAKARGKEMKVSHKAAREICKSIKGMMLSNAKEFLRDVMEKKKAVPYARYTKKIGHRHGLDKKYAGRYPIKAAEHILEVLKGAQANAENKGLDIERLRIIHAATSQGMKMKRFMPRAHGRASPKFNILTNVEIVLDEKPGE